eukprot:1633537-Rhodomonas_salina.3
MIEAHCPGGRWGGEDRVGRRRTGGGLEGLGLCEECSAREQRARAQDGDAACHPPRSPTSAAGVDCSVRRACREFHQQQTSSLLRTALAPALPTKKAPARFH